MPILVSFAKYIYHISFSDTFNKFEIFILGIETISFEKQTVIDITDEIDRIWGQH